jgi:hypothetical protein
MIVLRDCYNTFKMDVYMKKLRHFVTIEFTLINLLIFLLIVFFSYNLCVCVCERVRE